MTKPEISFHLLSANIEDNAIPSLQSALKFSRFSGS